MDARTQFLSDIIIGAVEGGTGYWAYAKSYHFSGEDLYPATVTLEDMEDGTEVELDTDAIEEGIARVLAPDFKVRSDIRAWIAEGSETNDAGDVDADCCDVIVQAYAFGEIIYG